MDLNLMLTHEGAEAQRQWAAVMPLVVRNIDESTEKLMDVYLSVIEDIGPHQDAFKEMLSSIKRAQEDFSESISVLSDILNLVADRIDHYVASSQEDGTSSPPQKSLKMRR